MKRKNALAVCLAAAAVMAFVFPAAAAETTKEQSLQLTVSKEAEYTLSIPASQSITMGQVTTDIGTVSVTGNIGTKQQVSVTVSKTSFVDRTGSGNSFVFSLKSNDADFTGRTWNSDEVRAEPPVTCPLTVEIPTETWAGVKAGSYSASITFTAELQSVE